MNTTWKQVKKIFKVAWKVSRNRIKKLQNCWKVMFLFTIFFDFSIIVRFEYLRQSRQLIRNDTCSFWSAWKILHASNRSCNRSRIRLDYFTKHQVNTIEQPPCSPDLVSCDFFLFTKLKSRKNIWILRRDKRKFDEGAERHIFIRLEKMHEWVGEA